MIMPWQSILIAVWLIVAMGGLAVGIAIIVTPWRRG